MSIQFPAAIVSKLSALRQRRRACGKRRGVAVVMVLGLLAITLALSYSMLRGQVMTAQLQQNFERSIDARYAAQTGMNSALRRLHEVDWQGVDVPVHGKIDEHTGYDITYTTGDPSLTPASPDWNEYPFRVTIRVVGYAEHPDQPTMKSRHTLETVVQLVRRALNADPSTWANVQPYALYQWANDDNDLNPPFRIEGDSLWLGQLDLAENYPPSSPRSRYFSDLKLMRNNSLGDFRPFGGTLTLKESRQTSSVLTSLKSELGLTTKNTSEPSSRPVSPPPAVMKYRLYPGGKEYDIPSLQAVYGVTMHNATAGPDPMANPLGVFRSDSWMTFGNNAKVIGTIISAGGSSDMAVLGTGVEFKGYTLPKLEGSSDSVQLPALLVHDDLRIYDGAGATIQGLAVVWDEFEVVGGSVATRLDLTGKLLTNTLEIRGRDEWQGLGLLTWTNSLLNFLNQLLGLGGSKYYPQYMQNQYGLAYQPKLTVKPNSDGVRYHWQDWNEPVYVKASMDTGLRWNVISQRTIVE